MFHVPECNGSQTIAQPCRNLFKCVNSCKKFTNLQTLQTSCKKRKKTLRRAVVNARQCAKFKELTPSAGSRFSSNSTGNGNGLFQYFLSSSRRMRNGKRLGDLEGTLAFSTHLALWLQMVQVSTTICIFGYFGGGSWGLKVL